MEKPLLNSFKIVEKRTIKDKGGNYPFYLPFFPSYSFTSKFRGIIPNQTKSRIDNAKSLFDSQVYIVAEADNWEGKQVDTIDPLVIGVRNSKCFLLDEFDCTKSENYVKMEFKE